jgi:hypothetical protein
MNKRFSFIKYSIFTVKSLYVNGNMLYLFTLLAELCFIRISVLEIMIKFPKGKFVICSNNNSVSV